MREGTVFTGVCLFTFWGVPHPRSRWGEVPHPRSGQVGTPSQVQVGGTPSQVGVPYTRSGQGGVPHPGSDRGGAISQV